MSYRDLKMPCIVFLAADPISILSYHTAVSYLDQKFMICEVAPV